MNKIAHTNFQCLGDSKQCRQRDVFEATFDITNVVVKFSFLCQLFQTQAGILAIFAYRLA